MAPLRTDVRLDDADSESDLDSPHHANTNTSNHQHTGKGSNQGYMSGSGTHEHKDSHRQSHRHSHGAPTHGKEAPAHTTPGGAGHANSNAGSPRTQAWNDDRGNTSGGALLPGGAAPPVEEIYECWSDKTKNGARFPSNYIRTTKYTLLTFLPKNLMEQFRKVSNIYFLLNMIIACIPGVSPVFPITSILPLVFVLAVAAIKDAVEDNRRYRADKAANGKKVCVVRDGQRIVVRSDDLAVGDFVRLERNDEVPADVIVIASGLEDGVTYIETANLDGETNLKRRAAADVTQHLTSEGSLNKCLIRVRADSPNPELAKWEGSLQVDTGTTRPLDLSNIIFRGCLIRNTPWMFAMIVYAGVDTKMFRNLKKKPPNFSGLDKKMNKLILALLLFQQAIIIVLSGLSIGFARKTGKSAFFLMHVNDTSGLLFIKNYGTFFVLLSFMMPISLFVSMELCKAFQAVFMEWDVRMQTDKKSMKAKTSNLNEELSQITHIFTDKTGTLTENEMRFHRCSVMGFSHCEPQSPGGIRTHLNKHGRFSEAIENFMVILAVCHTVVITEDEHTKKRIYEGDSTDEVALVTAADKNGFTLISRTSQNIVIEVMGERRTFELLAVLEFNSDRKRMGTVVRNEKGEIWLFSKGADSAMLSVVTCSTPDETKWYNHTVKELDSMARDGLRTLCMGRKRLGQQEFEMWKAKYDAAKLTSTNRQQAVDDVCYEMETKFELCGCTGIEDRLQDGVPETIHYFIQAGVVIWVLTGDKRETAVNIASSSKLVNMQRDSIHHLEAKTEEEFGRQIADVSAKTLEESAAGQKVTIVIDGVTLNFALGRFQHEFIALSQNVASAVCCRVTPKQKADVVAMFQGLGCTALAVGDGANDVSMIREGRVGIGIMGLEGSQAELASDYAIPKFRHLKRLVAVHGRYSMVRNAVLIQYSFYKNLLLVLVQIFFAFYNGFSGQTLFDSWALTFYNIVFTSLPPLLQGVFEKDIEDSIIERSPELLGDLPKGQNFNMRTICVWGLASAYHSILIFFFTSATFPLDDLNGDGKTSGIWVQGTLPMSAIITVALLKNAMHIRMWTWIPLAGLLFSYLCYYLYLLIYSSFESFMGSQTYYKVAFLVLGSSKYYLWLLFFCAGMLAIDMAGLFVQRHYFPATRDIVMMSNTGAAAKHSPTSPTAHTETVTAVGGAPGNNTSYAATRSQSRPQSQ